MLHLNFTDEQKEFRQRLQHFANGELSAGAKERAKLDHVTQPVVDKLSSEGLFKMTTPARYGGSPRDSVSIGLAFENICAVDWSAMSIMLSHVVAPIMLERASEELKEECKQITTFADKETKPDIRVCPLTVPMVASILSPPMKRQPMRNWDA